MGASLRIAIITLSDKGAAGTREDESGQILETMLSGLGTIASRKILPDEEDLLRAELVALADEGIALVVTTGGTGLSPRDVTPEATAAVIEREIPGMAEAMRAESLKKTPHAMLSRGRVGIRRRTLIVNLPGSPRGARENLEVILPALPHALAKIQGDPTDCAGN